MRRARGHQGLGIDVDAVGMRGAQLERGDREQEEEHPGVVLLQPVVEGLGYVLWELEAVKPAQ